MYRRFINRYWFWLQSSFRALILTRLWQIHQFLSLAWNLQFRCFCFSSLTLDLFNTCNTCLVCVHFRVSFSCVFFTSIVFYESPLPRMDFPSNYFGEREREERGEKEEEETKCNGGVEILFCHRPQMDWMVVMAPPRNGLSLFIYLNEQIVKCSIIAWISPILFLCNRFGLASFRQSVAIHRAPSFWLIIAQSDINQFDSRHGWLVCGFLFLVHSPWTPSTTNLIIFLLERNSVPGLSSLGWPRPIVAQIQST